MSEYEKMMMSVMLIVGLLLSVIISIVLLIKSDAMVRNFLNWLV